MKKAIIFILLFMALPVFAAPVMKMNKLGIDLGNVEQGRLITDETLQIVNKGDALLLLRAESTCDCLTVNPEKNKVKPGERARIRITLRTGDEKGNVRKTFYLMTNDPRFISLPVRVTAQIITGKQGPSQKLSSQEIESKGKSPDQNILIQRSSYASAVRLHYFYSSLCKRCLDLKERFFPELERKEKKGLILALHVLEKKEEFELLLKFRHYLHSRKSELPVVILGTNDLAGVTEIKNQLPMLLSRSGEFEFIPETRIRGAPAGLVRLSLWPIIGAGLVDGINPCAFATMIFLISYLAYLKRSRRMILLSGLFFTAAVFLTYFCVGLGLMAGFRTLPVFSLVARYVYLGLALFCFVLAFYSFKDFLLVRKGKSSEMKLQLSPKMKKRIHKAIRAETSRNWVLLSSFVLGVIVSFFELACTGQMYLPAIVYMTRASFWKGGTYLLLYNFLFVLPLILIFILFYSGLSSQRISDFFEKKLAIIKLLTTLLFIVLGLFLLFFVL